MRDFAIYGGSESCTQPRIAWVQHWAGILKFPGFCSGGFEFQPHPTAGNLLREGGRPALCPHFPRGMLGMLGGHEVPKPVGWWEQAGCMHDPKTQGPPWGVQVMRELQLLHPTAPLGMVPQRGPAQALWARVLWGAGLTPLHLPSVRPSTRRRKRVKLVSASDIPAPAAKQ